MVITSYKQNREKLETDGYEKFINEVYPICSYSALSICRMGSWWTEKQNSI